MKYIEETPWFICDEGDYNFCSYVDTDSNYFHAEPLLKHLNPDFDNLDTNEKDDMLEKVALQYQDIITDYYDTFAKQCPGRQTQIRNENRMCYSDQLILEQLEDMLNGLLNKKVLALRG